MMKYSTIEIFALVKPNIKIVSKTFHPLMHGGTTAANFLGHDFPCRIELDGFEGDVNGKLHAHETLKIKFHMHEH